MARLAAPVREHLLTKIVPTIARGGLREGDFRELQKAAEAALSPDKVAVRTAEVASRMSEQRTREWYGYLAEAKGAAVVVQPATGLGVAASQVEHGASAVLTGVFGPKGVDLASIARSIMITPLPAAVTPLDAAAESARLISLVTSSVGEATAESVRRAVREGQTAQELADVLKKEWTEQGVPSFMPTRRLGADGLPVLTTIETHATLVAEDQLIKVAAAEAAQQQRDAGVVNFRWVTQGDGRVRPAHAAHNGRVFSWEDGAGGDYPGQAPRCRCTAEPVLDDVVVNSGTVRVDPSVGGAPRERERAHERVANLREFRAAARQRRNLEPGQYLNVVTGQIEEA